MRRALSIVGVLAVMTIGFASNAAADPPMTADATYAATGAPTVTDTFTAGPNTVVTESVPAVYGAGMNRRTPAPRKCRSTRFSQPLISARTRAIQSASPRVIPANGPTRSDCASPIHTGGDTPGALSLVTPIGRGAYGDGRGRTHRPARGVRPAPSPAIRDQGAACVGVSGSRARRCYRQSRAGISPSVAVR